MKGLKFQITNAKLQRIFIPICILLLIIIAIAFLVIYINNQNQPSTQDENIVLEKDLEPVVTNNIITTSQVKLTLSKGYSVSNKGKNILDLGSCQKDCTIYTVDNNALKYYLSSPFVVKFSENISSEIKKTIVKTSNGKDVNLEYAITYLFDDEEIENDAKTSDEFLVIQAFGCYKDICFNSGTLNHTLDKNLKELDTFKKFISSLKIEDLQ